MLLLERTREMKRLKRMIEPMALPEEKGYCRCAFCGKDLPIKIKVRVRKICKDSVTWVDEERTSLFCDCPEATRFQKNMMIRYRS